LFIASSEIIGKLPGCDEQARDKTGGQHLQTVYPIRRKFGGPGKFARKRDAYMDEQHRLVSDRNAERIMNDWGPYLDLSKRYIVEKSPPNIIPSRFLQALFPQSKFVFTLRHPLVVSYATQKWAKTSIKALMNHTLFG
jgi:adenylate kinase family enzyme